MVGQHGAVTSHPRPSDAPADPSGLLRLALDVATEAGEHLLDAVRRQQVVETKSSRTDLVTESDRLVEARIVESLTAARPDDGVEGEEGASRPGTTGVTWCIDPIDGTTNFWYGLPGFNVSVAATTTEGTLAGVVVDPLHGDVYAASAGAGATRNGIAIHCSDNTDLSLALLATGFGYDPAVRAWQAQVLTNVLPRVRDIRRLGAAALDLCLVASGRVDAYYERGLAPWDHAAGALIATEAGARVGGLDGEPPGPELVVAAPRALWGPLTDLLRESGAATWQRIT